MNQTNEMLKFLFPHKIFGSRIILKEYFSLLECDCNTNGSASNICSEIGGSCNCLTGYTGKNCNTCDDNYFISDETNGKITCSGM